MANSAGHRVHLESDDPALDGLMCVECHSSSLHQFAATDETCAQSGCHTDIRVQLGRMGDFTIHCAACHGFSAPLPDTAGVETALAALAPGRNECLSCHVMRTLVEMNTRLAPGGYFGQNAILLAGSGRTLAVGDALVASPR